MNKLIEKADTSKYLKRIKKIKEIIFARFPEDIVIKRASNYDEIVQAYRLVHDTYVKKGFIDSYLSGMRIRVFDAVPQMAIHIAMKEGKVIATNSFCKDSELGLPSEKVFPKEIDELRKKGVIGEFTNCSVHPDFCNTGVSAEIMRCSFSYAYYKGCDYTVAVVSPAHKEFYKINLFDVLADGRNSSEKDGDIVVAMVQNLNDLEERAIQEDKKRGKEAAFLHKFWFEENF